MNRVANIALRIAEWRLQEDVYPRTSVDEAVIDALSHWHTQKDYEGPEWGGIEYFNFCLSKVVRRAAVEFPVGSAWYLYDSSSKGKSDGKDWRFVVMEPNQNPTTVVNCHSMVHDDSWTLTKTVYSSNEIDVDELAGIGHDDPWTRSMLWNLAVVRGLRDSNYEYQEVERDMLDRLRMGMEINKRLPSMIEEIGRNCLRVNGVNNIPSKVTVVVAKWRLPEGKIGSFRRPDEEFPWGILTVSPNAFEKNMVDVVLQHELCHAAVGKDPSGSHGEMFQALADALGIPEKWQD